MPGSRHGEPVGVVAVREPRPVLLEPGEAVRDKQLLPAPQEVAPHLVEDDQDEKPRFFGLTANCGGNSQCNDDGSQATSKHQAGSGTLGGRVNGVLAYRDGQAASAALDEFPAGVIVSF